MNWVLEIIFSGTTRNHPKNGFIRQVTIFDAFSKFLSILLNKSSNFRNKNEENPCSVCPFLKTHLTTKHTSKTQKPDFG